MALIYCPKCNAQISDKAESCPHCGNFSNILPIQNIVNTTFKLERPSSISLAVGLLIVMMIFGFVGSIILINQFKDAYKNNDVVGIGIFVGLLIFILSVFIIVGINDGKKWARTTYKVFFILSSILLFLSYNAGYFRFDIWSIINSIMQLIVIILLSTNESNKWFNRVK